MTTKKSYNPVDQIENFLLSIYGHCLSEGMTNKSAEKKTFRSAYEAIFSLQERADNNSMEQVLFEHSLAFQEFLSDFANSLIVDEVVQDGKEDLLEKVANVFESNKSLIEFFKSDTK